MFIIKILELFQGIHTLFLQDPITALSRILLIFLGFLLVYLGAKHVLEPLIMIPMGFGMAAVNAGVLILSANNYGNLFIAPMTQDADLMHIMQVNFLQPIYNLTFSNGLIACIVFMGIGVICDIGMVLSHPFIGMFIAMFAELGTVATYPIARLIGLTSGQSAAVSVIGGADGPMVLFTSLTLAPEYFVPITIVAYLYLSLTYGGYPFLLRFMIPKDLRGKVIITKNNKVSNISSKDKLIFAVIANTILCLLFPVAAPLFLSFFMGIAVRESGLEKYIKLIEDIFLYAATFFLGLILGTLCDAQTFRDPVVLKLLVLGMLALLISGIGGIIGGYLVYFLTGKRFNPTVGIAGVSCVPTTAKVAQKEVTKVNKMSFVMEYALSANICGVITTAILTGIYISLLSK